MNVFRLDVYKNRGAFMETALARRLDAKTRTTLPKMKRQLTEKSKKKKLTAVDRSTTELRTRAWARGRATSPRGRALRELNSGPVDVSDVMPCDSRMIVWGQVPV